MIENIQIINKNGDSTFTEGISYIEIIDTGKKYLFYTLNEKVDNDLTKIYISETADKIEDVNTISQEEWDELRKKMVKISHKETLENVKFISMGNKVFNVGEPKKLAVTTVAKQSFKDAQITHTLSTDTNEESVFNNTAFFNGSVIDKTTDSVQNVEETSSIFSSPPQPTIQNTDVNSEYSLPTSAANDNVSLASHIENSAPAEEKEKNLENANQYENEVVSESTIASSTEEGQNKKIEEKIISDEEALKAINIIQDYLDHEGNE